MFRPLLGASAPCWPQIISQQMGPWPLKGRVVMSDWIVPPNETTKRNHEKSGWIGLYMNYLWISLDSNMDIWMKQLNLEIELDNGCCRRVATSDLGPRTSDLGSRFLTSDLLDNDGCCRHDVPTSDLGSRTSGLGPRTSDLGSRTSNLGPRTSHLEPRTSNLGPRAAHLRPRVSDLGSRTSGLGPRISGLGPRLGPRVADIEPGISDLGSRTSGLASRTSGRGPRAWKL